MMDSRSLTPDLGGGQAHPACSDGPVARDPERAERLGRLAAAAAGVPGLVAELVAELVSLSARLDGLEAWARGADDDVADLLNAKLAEVGR